MMAHPTSRWTQTVYDLVSFQVVNGFEAVFAVDAEDELLDLISEPVDGIGLAKARILFWEGGGFSTNAWKRQYKPADAFDCVVAMRLIDGTWEIANESCNYAGMQKTGAKIEAAISELPGAMLSKLRCFNK